jgi:hypothetical protein
MTSHVCSAYIIGLQRRWRLELSPDALRDLRQEVQRILREPNVKARAAEIDEWLDQDFSPVAQLPSPKDEQFIIHSNTCLLRSIQQPGHYPFLAIAAPAFLIPKRLIGRFWGFSFNGERVSKRGGLGERECLRALFEYTNDLTAAGPRDCPADLHGEKFYLVRFIAEGLRHAADRRRPPVPDGCISDLFDCLAALVRSVGHCGDEMCGHSWDLACDALDMLIPRWGKAHDVSEKLRPVLGDMCARHRTDLRKYARIQRFFAYSSRAFADEVANVADTLLDWADAGDGGDPDLVRVYLASLYDFVEKFAHNIPSGNPRKILNNVMRVFIEFRSDPIAFAGMIRLLNDREVRVGVLSDDVLDDVVLIASTCEGKENRKEMLRWVGEADCVDEPSVTYSVLERAIIGELDSTTRDIGKHVDVLRPIVAEWEAAAEKALTAAQSGSAPPGMSVRLMTRQPVVQPTADPAVDPDSLFFQSVKL